MRLILIGCEYAGTTTLANAINEWTQKTLGKEFSLIHDHFKLPDSKPHGPALTDAEVAQFQALSPRMTEVVQRPFTQTARESCRRARGRRKSDG